MVGEVLIDLFFDLFSALFVGLEFVALPTQLIGTLGTLASYGVWVVGADVLAYFVACVGFWWAFHMSIGLIVWVWDRLPLT